MKLSKYLTRFRFNDSASKKIFLSNVFLVLMLVVSLHQNLTEKAVVILKANPYCEDVELGHNFINEANQQRLSVLVAKAMGGITPKNSKYQADTVLSFAAPSVYQKVKDILDIKIEELKKERISISFTPERVFTEDGITYVTGGSQTIGATGITRKNSRTYEFRWSVANYSPTFSYVDVYDDLPRDLAWQEKEAIKNKEK